MDNPVLVIVFALVCFFFGMISGGGIVLEGVRKDCELTSVFTIGNKAFECRVKP